jgi:hypothetical protein
MSALEELAFLGSYLVFNMTVQAAISFMGQRQAEEGMCNAEQERRGPLLHLTKWSSQDLRKVSIALLQKPCDIHLTSVPKNIWRHSI